MMSDEEFKKKMGDRKIKVVSEATGVPYQTIWNYLTGRSNSMAHTEFIKLVEYLETHQ